MNEDIIIKDRGERANTKNYFFLSEGDIMMEAINWQNHVDL